MYNNTATTDNNILFKHSVTTLLRIYMYLHFYHVAKLQCMKLCRYRTDQYTVKINSKYSYKKSKCDPCDFYCGMSVDARWVGLKISENEITQNSLFGFAYLNTFYNNWYFEDSGEEHCFTCWSKIFHRWVEVW